MRYLLTQPQESFKNYKFKSQNKITYQKLQCSQQFINQEMNNDGHLGSQGKKIISFTNMESIQNELQKCYTDPQLVAFILHQISQIPAQCKPLVKSYRKYVGITVTLPSQTSKYHFKVHPNQVEFVIVLSRGYPCTAPRLHLKTCITSPGFDDTRNLIYEVLDKNEWNHMLGLQALISRIGDMLGRLDHNKNVYGMARFGQFCLNTVYPVQLIRQIRGTDIYYVFQSDSDNNLGMYIADISSTHLTLFLTKQQPHIEKGSLKIPIQQDVKSCMLVFVAELGAISELLINNQTNFNDIELKFVCRKPQGLLSKKLKIRKGQSFLKKLVQNLNSYNLVEIKFEPDQEKLSEQEKRYLGQVSENEKELQRRFNKDTIQKLNNNYQKIVQFYSGINSPYYAIFVQKITILLQRYDVRLILQAGKGSSNPSSAKQNANHTVNDK